MLFNKLLNYTQFFSLYFSFLAQGRIYALLTWKLRFTCPMFLVCGVLLSSGDCKIQLHRSLNETSVLTFPASLVEKLRAVAAQDNLCGLLISKLSLSLSRWEWQDSFGKSMLFRKPKFLCDVACVYFCTFLVFLGISLLSLRFLDCLSWV